MHKNLLIALMVFMVHSPLCLAADAPAATEIGESDVGIHVFVGGYRDFPGIGFAANHVIDGHWTLGGNLWAMRSRLSEHEGGDLDHAQYYAQYLDQRAIGLEGTATFFIREDGVRRWGPLVRGGLGYSYRRTSANWTRYDRDPAWITFGSGNRQLDSGEGETRDLSTFYTRVGAAFQFALGKQSLASGGGHILELGINGVIPFSRKSASFTKPITGEIETVQTPFIEPMLDISYRIIF
ncbi:MAG: hypothetical protein ACXVA9_05385 [Bdellovibrionales bacterium]